MDCLPSHECIRRELVLTFVLYYSKRKKKSIMASVYKKTRLFHY
uniref:Uncharacterized protein n=1 Tax=Lepeophtheirus salmonis TaxID=72036 RepID=A0A0K2UAI2_LEPSM